MTSVQSEPVDAYRALDGTLVEVPPPPMLEDGPMPVFGPQDQIWLNKLIAFRDRAIRNEYPLLRIQINARLKEAKRKFGKDGSGYLDMLNDGSALQNFWATLRQILCQRIGLMKYHAPDEQQIIRDLLARFPERIWLPIIAEQCWPTTEHRKSEHVHELMASYLAGPRADFRHLETGAAKPERESDLPDMVKRAVLGAAFGQHTALATFKNMALDPENLPDTPQAQLEHGQKTADLLRNFGAIQLSDEQAALVEELFRK